MWGGGNEIVRSRGKLGDGGKLGGGGGKLGRICSLFRHVML